MLRHSKWKELLETPVQLNAYISLKQFPENTVEHIAVYGGDQPVAALKFMLPNTRVMSRESLKSCLLPYLAIGWTGYIPGACKNTQLHIPEKIGLWLWGWPEKFVDRMEKNNTRTIIVG